MLAPYLVGHPAVPIQRVVDGIGEGDAPRLALASVGRLRDDHVWERYRLRV